MKRPSFQFYPGDWQGNAKLRRCSHAERGIWLEVMCLLHDAEEYGAIRWPLKDIAQAVGCKVAELKSLQVKGVLKGADTGHRCEPFIFTPRHANKDGEPVTLIESQAGPIWYSSRMVRDEYVRTKRGIGSRFGEEPKPPNGDSPKPPIGDGASSSSSSSSSKKAAASGLSTEERPAAAARSLIFPQNLPQPTVSEIAKALNGHARAQDFLDELAGKMTEEKVGKPAGFIVTLMRQEAEGSFVPTYAPRIQAEREQAQAQSELAKAGRDEGGQRVSTANWPPQLQRANS